MINIVCVKIGEKYSSTYVNNLYSMCKTHITLPFTFYCYTDNNDKIDPNIRIIDYVYHNLTPITHNKLFLFSEHVQKHFEHELCTFFDLDLIIKRNADEVVSFVRDELTVIHARYRGDKPEGGTALYHPFNSSCMTWKKGKVNYIWDYYNANKEQFQKTYWAGMDPFLFYEFSLKQNKIKNFPFGMFYSYLFGIDDRLTPYAEWNKNPIRSNYKFKVPVILFNSDVDQKAYAKIIKFYID